MTTEVSTRSTPQWVLHWATTTPDAVAVLENGKSFTYRELAYNTVQYVQLLQSIGVKKGMLVGIQCNYSYLHLLLVLASEVIGATTTLLSEGELSASNDLIRRCALLCVENPNEFTQQLTGILVLDQPLLNHASSIAVETLASLDVARNDNDVVRLVTSSGTTGQAKAIPLTEAVHRRRILNCIVFQNYHKMPLSVISVGSMPLGAGIHETKAALIAGQKIVFTDAASVSKNLEVSGASYMIISPRIALEILESLSASMPAIKAETIVVIGGSVSDLLRERLLRVIAHQVLDHYGTGETGRISGKEEGGAGVIFDDTVVRIVDHAGRPLALGQTGWIEVQSPRCAAGYLWNPQLTQKHFVNGWFRTFDVGYMLEPGKLVVLGRGDDVLNIGGVKIVPQPIEDKIRALASVSDAVLLALPSPTGIDSLHVVIERADKSLDQALATQIQPLMPHGAFQCHFLDRMPRTETGKVQRNVLRDLLLRHMQAAAPTRH